MNNFQGIWDSITMQGNQQREIEMAIANLLSQMRLLQRDIENMQKEIVFLHAKIDEEI